MIHICFVGRLGNQMFQYTAARLAAERLRCPFLVEESEFTVTYANLLKKESEYALFRLFPDLHQNRFGIAAGLVRRTCPRLANRLFDWMTPTTFIPRNFEGGQFYSNEVFDPRYFELEKGTRLVGYFQSPKYFAGLESQIRDWFAIPQSLAEQARCVFEKAGIDPSRTAAVHVRLGDYRTQMNIVGYSGEGWLLSRDYYRRALSCLPNGVSVAVFSDEPEHAEEYIGRKADLVGRGSQYLDFAMISKCRFVVSGNSTFSWWAAWISSQSNGHVIAPRYFLGWRYKEWFPADIMVEGWEYV